VTTPASSAPAGYLCLVLHAHLPFVRHPEHEDFLEEDWLFEAITETYIPLLQLFEALERDGLDFRLTMSLTPSLIEMLGDPLLRRRYTRHLGKLCELAEKEVGRTRHLPEFSGTAQMYLERFTKARHDYSKRWHGDLVGAFARHQKAGRLEIITCAATHGYLPLLRLNPAAVRAQLAVAVEHYAQTFGRAPRGIWLPECGFYPGLDEVLKEFGLRFFFVDSHGLERAASRPQFGVHAPLFCPSGVAAFGRDGASSQQVWSAEQGYPGDAHYREFYRDIGFDLELDYLRPYIHRDGLRINTGIKYHRITGRTEAKEPYLRATALAKAAEHAAHFVASRRRQAAELRRKHGRAPVIVAPYDAELFGHWWFEGPEWLEAVLRACAAQRDLALATPADYLAAQPVQQLAMPAASSWGWKGHSEIWLNRQTDWIYPHLHHNAGRMCALTRRFPAARGIKRRALNQAARELLLAQASDWAFIISRGTFTHYAAQRTRGHLLAFNELHDALLLGRLDTARLAALEQQDNIFPTLDYRVYSPPKKNPTRHRVSA
jgi:1,4-alpha-glucan branching enzyme